MYLLQNIENKNKLTDMYKWFIYKTEQRKNTLLTNAYDSQQ